MSTNTSEMLSEPKKIASHYCLIQCFDEIVKYFVRKAIHDLFHRVEITTLDEVLIELRNTEIPNMSLSTSYKFMKRINFRYMTRNRYNMLLERDDIVR